MRSIFATFAFSYIVGRGIATPSSSSSSSMLNLTTIGANDQQESIIQCWQLAAPLASSSTPGTSGAATAQLGSLGKGSFSVLPARFDGGLHNAPAVQWVAFLSGKAVISLPDSDQTATVRGGKNGLILAADTAKYSTKGHITRYPSNIDTVALQFPLENDQVPDHVVLHSGPCNEDTEQNF